MSKLQQPLPLLKLLSKQSSQGEQIGNSKVYLLMVIANFIGVFMKLSYKCLTLYFNQFLLLSIRGSCLFLLNRSLIQYNGLNTHTPNHKGFKLLVTRAIMNSISVALAMGSLKYIPIGVASALQNISPIITFFIQRFYHKKEKIRWINLVIIIGCFIGIILIIQPEFLFQSNVQPQVQIQPIFYILPLCAAFTNSFSLAFLRDLKDQCHELVVLEYTYIFQCFSCCGIFLVVFGISQQEAEVVHAFSYGQIGKLIGFMMLAVLFSYASQYIRTWSIFMCSPALVQPFNYLGVVFGILVDVIIFDISYNIITFIGVMLTSLGLISKFLLLLSAKKSKSHQPQLQQQQIPIGHIVTH